MYVVRRIARVVLALFFIAAGINHFVHPGVYVRMVPPWLASAALLVQITSICEMLGGIGVLIHNARRLAGAGLIALLIASFRQTCKRRSTRSYMQISVPHRNFTCGFHFNSFSSLGFGGPASRS